MADIEPTPAPQEAPHAPDLLDLEFLGQFFSYAHLPAHLAAVSKPFADLARTIIEVCPQNPERTTALRKLLESKDCAVRARVAKFQSRV